MSPARTPVMAMSPAPPRTSPLVGTLPGRGPSHGQCHLHAWRPHNAGDTARTVSPARPGTPVWLLGTLQGQCHLHGHQCPHSGNPSRTVSPAWPGLSPLLGTPTRMTSPAWPGMSPLLGTPHCQRPLHHSVTRMASVTRTGDIPAPHSGWGQPRRHLPHRTGNDRDGHHRELSPPRIVTPGLGTAMVAHGVTPSWHRHAGHGHGWHAGHGNTTGTRRGHCGDTSGTLQGHYRDTSGTRRWPQRCDLSRDRTCWRCHRCHPVPA